MRLCRRDHIKSSSLPPPPVIDAVNLPLLIAALFKLTP